MKNHTATTEFKTSTGADVKVTAELILEETIYTDGDNVKVDCCEKGLVIADIDGFPQQTGFSEYLKPIDSDFGAIYGSIGKLGLIAENLKKVKDAIAELEQHPAWVAKQAKIEKNQKEIAEMEAKRIANGYCPKCGSYCYGDCEAN